MLGEIMLSVLVQCPKKVVQPKLSKHLVYAILEVGLVLTLGLESDVLYSNCFLLFIIFF